MKDKRSETSAENGRKGGRPVSEATLRTQFARKYISEKLEDSLQPIVAKAINDALLGDKYAREWLSNYAWGKPHQPVDLGVNEEEILDDAALEKARAAIGVLVGTEDAGGGE